MMPETFPAASPASGGLHPAIYRIMLVLAAWFVIAAWGFSDGGHIALDLAMMTALVIVIVGIPVLSWRIWRNQGHAGDAGAEPGSLKQWSAREFQIWNGRTTGADAMVEILTPLFAGALGLTAFAIVFRLVS
ncbi:MAG TPA: hypothetical protein VEU47_04555 [Candidatus Cybelea sp.]|nr:hypothetical protein [Candidatus Cybelea sp.]